MLKKRPFEKHSEKKKMLVTNRNIIKLCVLQDVNKNLWFKDTHQIRTLDYISVTNMTVLIALMII